MSKSCYTDDWKRLSECSQHLRKDGRHKTIRHKLRVYAKGDIYTNTVESAFSLFKRGIMGTWHQDQREASPSVLRGNDVPL